MLLTCEGVCNGGRVQAFDREVHSVGRQVATPAGGTEEDRRTITLLDPAWLDHVRHFRYTEHEPAGVSYAGDVAKLVFACMECRVTRIFGFA